MILQDSMWCKVTDYTNSSCDGSCGTKPTTLPAKQIDQQQTQQENKHTEDRALGSEWCTVGTELEWAYCFARKHDITTIDTIPETCFDGWVFSYYIPHIFALRLCFDYIAS